ncbi:MAG: hypothetical protein VXV98_10275, partial [Candidatus Thermoplasmatota archaeon]|nr:hypothetical protein [Candidatus Thermoplasmatota archaeon]
MTCFSSDAPASNVNTYTNEDGIHEGLRKVYQWPGNNGYSGTFMLSGSLTLTSSQNQVLKNADEVPLKPGSLTLGPNMHVCGIGPQSAPVCYDPDSDALVEYAPEDFGGRVLALDSDCVLRFDAEVLCRGFTDTRGVYTGSRLPHL